MVTEAVNHTTVDRLFWERKFLNKTCTHQDIKAVIVSLHKAFVNLWLNVKVDLIRGPCWSLRCFEGNVANVTNVQLAFWLHGWGCCSAVTPSTALCFYLYRPHVILHVTGMQ